MPQATPTRTTDKDRLRSRPSVNARNLTADNAPVLFRLPIVGATPQANESPAGKNPAGSPAGTGIAGVAMAGAGIGSAGIGSAGIGSAGIAPPSNSPPISCEPSQLPQAYAVSPSEPAPQASAASPSVRASAPEAQLAAATKATWWEHWSSGVVLILLIIALVTASILALNDGRKSSADQLAGEPVAALDEFDLSNITIPEVVSGTPPSSPQTSLSAQTTAISSQSPAPVEFPASLPTPSVATPASTAAAQERTSRSSHMLATTAQASLSPPADANVTPNTSAESAGSMLENGAAAPLAALTAPEPVSPAPLFDPNSANELSSQLPPLPSFNPSGSTPALYDGAARSSELHAANQEPSSSPLALPNSMPQMSQRTSSMPEMITNVAPIETNLPSFATVLTSAAQPALPPLPATNSEVQPTSFPKPIPSATPDSDAAALASAYLHFSEINKASNGLSTNRWSTPTTTSPPPIGPSTPTGGMGFTLGNQPAQ